MLFFAIFKNLFFVLSEIKNLWGSEQTLKNNFGTIFDNFDLMIQLKTFLLLFFIGLGFVSAQSETKKDTLKPKIKDSSSVENRQNTLELKKAESVANTEIKESTVSGEIVELNEVLLVSRFKFNSRTERRKYLILRKKTKHVWPYAVLASKRLGELSRRLKKIDRGYRKSKYIKIVQRYIEKEFTEELKKLTKTEGQILIKLMYRQIGRTTFDVIQDLRSGWRAFWYNTTASLFNISLKKEYHPESIEEDYMIEHILRRSFQSGDLKPHEPAFRIDFGQLTDNYHD